MAVADGGELIVLAPGITSFGEDRAIDGLIRRHGYRGTSAIGEALSDDEELASNLAAAAHLIHGSSNGRFTITYCTDPAAGGLDREAVESVGFAWRPLPAERQALGLVPDQGSVPPEPLPLTTGDRTDRRNQPFFFVDNPALGLWADRARFANAGSSAL
jgi:hypothetical protein